MQDPSKRPLIEAIRHRPTLRRLCGWETLGEVPPACAAARQAGAFARDGRPQRIPKALIKTPYDNPLAKRCVSCL